MDMHSDTSTVGLLHETRRQGATDANSSPQETAALEPPPEEIAKELKLILASPPFRPSKRSQEFFFFVVQHSLEGNAEPLKERTIGAEIFHRPIGYDTGYDSVVRVLAGDVRRRLHLYYSQARPADSRVQIDLPTGSYAPSFSWLPAPPNPVVVIDPLAAQDGPAETIDEAASQPEETDSTRAEVPVRQKRLVWLLSAGTMLAAACLSLVFFRSEHTAIAQFWAPMVAPDRPVLIYLPKLLCYRVSDELYRRTAKSPGEFALTFDRLNLPPHLGPNDTIRWSEMQVDTDQGPGTGDIKAAIQLSKFLQTKHVESDVRIGTEFSFEDMRTSPTVLIGAFSNRWTLQLTKGLHYSFEDEGDHTEIRENGGTGQKWLSEWDSSGHAETDYGLVTRLVNPKTGQFSIVVAGIGSNGSEAAAELVTDPQAFAKAMANVPSDWSKKNLQILVKVSLTDLMNGPPVVLGTYVW